MAGTPKPTEKIMSLTLADFHRSVKALAPDLEVSDGQTDFAIPEGEDFVFVRYEALESATLGGLLAMPRARVTIDLRRLDLAQREAFLTRFDRAFQRGGG